MPKPIIDELPTSESVSRIVAQGLITRNTVEISITLGGQSFIVPLAHRAFSNGGFWSFFVCGCGRRARRLRLFQDQPRCRYCCLALGARNRSDWLDPDRRAELAIPRRLARLNDEESARLHPRRGQKLDRRNSIEAALRQSMLEFRRGMLKRAGVILDDTKGENK
jgi:hypothetical protein